VNFLISFVVFCLGSWSPKVSLLWEKSEQIWSFSCWGVAFIVHTLLTELSDLLSRFHFFEVFSNMDIPFRCTFLFEFWDSMDICKPYHLLLQYKIWLLLIWLMHVGYIFLIMLSLHWYLVSAHMHARRAILLGILVCHIHMSLDVMRKQIVVAVTVAVVIVIVMTKIC